MDSTARRIAAARRMFASREASRQADLTRLLETARADFERVVTGIIDTCRPVEIWQWGSLLYPETFTAERDIDIGLVGVSVQDHVDLMRATEDTTCLPLHIARLEEMDPRYVEHIRTFGKRVY